MKRSIINNEQKKKIREMFIPFLLCILILVFMIIRISYYALYGKVSLNSDVSAQMVLADLMNRQHTIFPTDEWYYSSQIVLLSQWPYQIGLLISNDWHVARTIALVIFLIITIASYLLMGKELKLSYCGALSSLAFLCTFGQMYSGNVMEGMMYFSTIYEPFIILFMILKIQYAEKKNKLTNAIWFAIFILFSFICGLESIRIFLTLFLPLLAATFIVGLLNFKTVDVGENSFKSVLRKSASFRLFVIVLSGMVSAGIGYIVEVKVLAKFFHFQNFGASLTLDNLSISSFFEKVSDLLPLMGYQSGVPVASRAGIRSLAALFLLILSFIALIRTIQKWNSYSNHHRVFLLFCWLNILFTILVDAMTGQETQRYLIPSFLFIFIAMHIVWQNEDYHNKLSKYIWAIVFVMCLVVIDSWQIDVMRGNSEPPNELSNVSPDLEEATDWLEEKGYDNGYSTFWLANVSEELSDGELEIRSWPARDPLSMNAYPWLEETEQVHTNPVGKVFVLLSDEENQSNPPYAKEDHLTFETDNYYIYTYKNWEELYGFREK